MSPTINGGITYAGRTLFFVKFDRIMTSPIIETSSTQIKTKDQNSFDRLTKLLLLFSRDDVPSWSVGEADHELGLSSSHTYRYFRSLSAAGFIAQISTGKYVLGPAIVQLDRKMRQSDPLILNSITALKYLISHSPVKSVAIICRYFHGQVMCIHEEFEKKEEYEVSYERGMLRPLSQGAASKSILAHLPLRSVKAQFEKDAQHFADFGLGGSWDEVKLILRKLRAAETVYTCGELGRGAAGISSPVFDGDKVVGSISIVIPEQSASETLVATISPIVALSAKMISDRF